MSLSITGGGGSSKKHSFIVTQFGNIPPKDRSNITIQEKMQRWDSSGNNSSSADVTGTKSPISVVCTRLYFLSFLFFFFSSVNKKNYIWTLSILHFLLQLKYFGNFGKLSIINMIHIHYIYIYLNISISHSNCIYIRLYTITCRAKCFPV